MFHPFLLAVYPVLYLYSHNLNELGYQPFWLIAIAAAATVLAAVLYFLFRKITADKIKAGIFTSIFLVFFFSYEYFRNILNKLNKIIQIGLLEHQYIIFLCFWALIFMALFYFLRKSKNLFSINKFLNVFAVTLMVFVLMGIFSHIASRQKAVLDNLSAEDKAFIEAFKKRDQKQLPDVYYIVPDGYENLDGLKEYFGYDSAEFIKFLNQKEFQIAKHSKSNYPSTQYSLTATLNMKYLDPSLTEGAAVTMEMLRQNKVIRIFKELGYKFITFSSGNSITNYNKNADIQLDGAYINEFSAMFLRSTVLHPFLTGRWPIGYNLDNEDRKRILFTFDKLGNEVPGIESPKFIFAHINLPHMPYLFDRNGQAIYVAGYGDQFKPEDISAFLEYSIFGAKKIQETVDGILRNSKNPPVIIVQSDHGFTIGEDEGLTDTAYSDKGTKLRYSNFSTYYLPGMKKNLLPQDITPVNTFRFIFNTYFGAKYPMLENKHFFRTHSSDNFPEIPASKLR